MKKSLMIFLIFSVTPGVFAQFHWSVSSQFNTSLFSRQTPLGERAEKTVTVGDRIYYNEYTTTNPNNPPNPNNVVPFGVTRGTYTYFTDTQNFFNYGRGTWGAGNSLRLNLGYRNDNAAFHTSVYLDRLVIINESNANEGIGKDDFNADGSDHSLVANDGRTPNWADILRYAFEEWYIRAGSGFLTAYIGITGNSGKVQTFNNQSDFLLRGVQVAAYGVLAPTTGADFVHDGLDTNNLVTSGAPSTSTMNKTTSLPYIMIAARFANQLSFPLTVQVSADPGNNGGIGADFSYRRMHGALRLSGEEIGGRVNFDAIYKIAGGDPVTTDDYDPSANPIGTLQPGGEGFLTHQFGLYANILNAAGFGFGLGYSAYLKTFEDFTVKDTGKIIPKTGPLFTGFDLRIQYAGIDKLVLTSFNNVSFGKSDTASDDRYVIGVTGIQLPNDSAQDWFALFNSFTAVWNVTDRLALSAQLANRYGVITTDYISNGVAAQIERSRLNFGGGMYAAYRFSWFNLQIGFAFRRLIESYSNTGTPVTGATEQTINGFRDASGGSFDISFPIQLTFQF